MSDGIPLRQILEPGHYRVEWALPTQDGTRVTLQGDLELRADRPPRGNAYGEGLASWESEGTTRHAGFPQVYEASLVSGELLNGQHVVLVDAVVEVWFADRVLIHGRAALVGRSALGSEKLDIMRLAIQVEGIDAITGIPPIQKVKIPVGGRKTEQRYLDWSWEAVGQPDSSQIWSDDSAKVELQFYSSVSAPEGFFFRVTFSPIVLVTFSTSAEFGQVFSHWVEPLRRLVTLSTGRQERITYLSVWIRDSESGEQSEFQVYGAALHQAPFSSRGNDLLKVERAFLISPEHLSLLALIRRWQVLIDEHHPLLETYASLMFAPEQHPRSRFLLLIQAIEGLHGFETRQEFGQRIETHSSRRDLALNEAAEHVGSETMQFLRKYLMKRPPNSLDTAIIAILDGVPVDVTPALKESDLIAEVMRDERSPKHVTECLRLVRNDLAHGTRGYDAQKLHHVVELLDSVVRAHLLRILDCPEDVQKRTQERRR